MLTRLIPTKVSFFWARKRSNRDAQLRRPRCHGIGRVSRRDIFQKGGQQRVTHIGGTIDGLNEEPRRNRADFKPTT